MSDKPLRKMKICETCGVSFPPKKSDQRYCSDDCRADYYRIHFPIQQAITKICPQCNTDFPTTCPIKQTYCGPECRRAAQKGRAHKTITGGQPTF